MQRYIARHKKGNPQCGKAKGIPGDKGGKTSSKCGGSPAKSGKSGGRK